MLGFSLHAWENSMVVFLIIAGFFALLAGVATWAVVRLQRIEISESKAELDKYKLEAGEKIAAADASGRVAQAEAAKANAETAKANERTAELKLALEKEIAARQPRTISPNQHAQLVAYLKTAEPKGNVVVVWKLFDEEAEKFGKQVLSVLVDAGFNAKAGDGPLSFGERGAWIVVRDLAKLSSTPNSVGAIQHAFQVALNILFDGTQRKDPFPDLGEVVVAIGAKPF
jgi:hypothetical protein